MMVPWGYEPGLMGMQLQLRKSIFACEEATVYTNTVMDLGGTATSVVDADLHCDKGGIWYTALNTGPFRKLWNQVVQDGHYRRHSWTVKADADAVFVPRRLRSVVLPDEALSQAGAGTFLNNCHYGLHGPLEVLSRAALDAYAVGWSTRCGAELAPQEDAWLQRCMLELGVREVDRFDSLLAEPACKTPGWDTCTGPQTTFHPFKTDVEYKRCLAQIDWTEQHPATSTTTATATTTSLTTSTRSTTLASTTAAEAEDLAAASKVPPIIAVMRPDDSEIS